MRAYFEPKSRYIGRCFKCGGSYLVGSPIYLSRNSAQESWQKFHEVCAPDDVKQFVKTRGAGFAPQPVPQTIPTNNPGVPHVELPNTDGGENFQQPAPTISDDYIRKIAKEIVDKHAVKVDELENLVSLIQNEITTKFEKFKPESRILEIKLPTGETKKIDGVHFYFERVVKLVAAGIPVLLWGPAGTGKTTTAMQVAQALSREFEMKTFDRSAFAASIFGFPTAGGGWITTEFSRSWEEGKVFIADELDLAPGGVQTNFNTALAQKIAALAWGNKPQHEKFAFIGCANTPLAKTRNFPDRENGSQAFKDRLYFMYWPMDINIMRRASGRKEEPVPKRYPRKPTIQEWEAWVERVISYCFDNAPTVVPGPRAFFTGWQALELGEDVMEVADGMVFRGCDEDLKAKILNAVPLPR